MLTDNCSSNCDLANRNRRLSNSNGNILSVFAACARTCFNFQIGSDRNYFRHDIGAVADQIRAANRVG